MANIVDNKMDHDKQEVAIKILKAMNVDNLKVSFNNKTQEFHFVQDRRVVKVPLELAQNRKASGESIRYLFRAILGHENGVWNRAADGNTWGGKNFYK